MKETISRRIYGGSGGHEGSLDPSFRAFTPLSLTTGSERSFVEYRLIRGTLMILCNMRWERSLESSTPGAGLDDHRHAIYFPPRLKQVIREVVRAFALRKPHVRGTLI